MDVEDTFGGGLLVKALDRERFLGGPYRENMLEDLVMILDQEGFVFPYNRSHQLKLSRHRERLREVKKEIERRNPGSLVWSRIGLSKFTDP